MEPSEPGAHSSSPALDLESSSASRTSTSTHPPISSATSTSSLHHRRPGSGGGHRRPRPEIYPAASFAGPLLAKSLTRFKSRVVVVETGGGGSVHRKKFGLIGCIVVILGCVLGSGIFAAPEAILKLTGNAGVTLLVWFVAGLIAFVAAVCFVELGCTFPVSGGDYVYLKECFGSYPAFLFQISLNLIITPVCGAILGTTVAKNLIIPNIPKDLICPNGSPAPNVVRGIQLVAVMLIMLVVLISCKFSELVAKIQGSLMIVNIGAISLMVTCGLVAIGMHGGMPHANFVLALQPGVDAKGQVLIIVKALFQASFSYFGYTYANYITEELERPLRNLPLGVGISLPIIIGINILINFCYIATISVADMGKTQTIADDMFRAVLPSHVAPYLAWFATTLVAISVTGGLMSFMLTCSRLPYAGARNGDFPPVFKLVDMNNGTPVPSIIFIGLLSTVFCVVGTIEDLILVASYLESTFNCLCIYGLIYLRFKRPLLHRPIKLPLIVHIMYAVVGTILSIVPIITVDSSNYLTSIAPLVGVLSTLLLGTPLYFIFIRKTRTWPWLLALNSGMMRLSQKLWLLIPDDVLDREDEDLDFDPDLNDGISPSPRTSTSKGLEKELLEPGGPVPSAAGSSY